MKAEYQIDKRVGLSVIEWTPKPYIESFHWHSEMEIGYCVSGRGEFHFGEKVFEVEAGDIFVVNNLERHIARSDERDPSVYYFVFFDPTMLLKEDKELLLPFVYNPAKFTNRIPGTHTAAEEIGQLILKLWHEQARRKDGYRTVMRGILMQICALLYRYYGRNIPKLDMNNAYLQYEKMQPVLSYLKKHFREDLQLKDLAAKMKLSSSRASHVFAQSVGEGFKEHLLQLRVNEAKRLLTQTQLSVIEVCLQSGFQSTTPFYRAFRQIVGLTPQEYRERTSVITLSQQG